MMTMSTNSDEWSAIQETQILLSIPGMRESIQEGMATPLEDCIKELTWCMDDCCSRSAPPVESR